MASKRLGTPGTILMLQSRKIPCREVVDMSVFSSPHLLLSPGPQLEFPDDSLLYQMGENNLGRQEKQMVGGLSMSLPLHLCKCPHSGQVTARNCSSVFVAKHLDDSYGNVIMVVLLRQWGKSTTYRAQSYPHTPFPANKKDAEMATAASCCLSASIPMLSCTLLECLL